MTPNIYRCRACHGDLDDTPLLEMARMPLAGGFADTEQEAKDAKLYPLTWVRCVSCTLIQVLEEIPDDELFDTYHYASSTIPALVNHFADYAAFLADRFGRDEPIRVVEMGCNDGVLLRQLPEAWYRVGVDPSDVAWRVRHEAPYMLIPEYFTPDVIGVAPDLRGRCDLVIASNCLAHTSRIDEAFEAAHVALRPGGEFWIEVHDLHETVRLGQWDTIYHEHKAEYSMLAMARIATKHGFGIRQTITTPLHGGSVRVGLEKGYYTGPYLFASPHIDSLRQRYERRFDDPVLTELSRYSGRVVAYGAAGRAVVWLNQMNQFYQAVVDDSPARQGKFIPRLATPITSWSQRPTADAIIITAWNYADAIRAAHPEYKGQWLQTWESVHAT